MQGQKIEDSSSEISIPTRIPTLLPVPPKWYKTQEEEEAEQLDRENKVRDNRATYNQKEENFQRTKGYKNSDNPHKKRKQIEKKKEEGLPLMNRYDALSETSDDETDEESSLSSQRNRKINCSYKDPQIQGTSSEDKSTPTTSEPIQKSIDITGTEQQEKTKRVYIPPIVITGVTNTLQMRLSIKEIIKHGMTIIPRKNAAKIMLNDITDYRAVMKAIQENKVQHFTYSTGEEKTKRVVVRGLPIDQNTEEILEELRRRGYKARSSKQLISFGPEKRLMPLFLVVFEQDAGADPIRDIQELCDCKVQLKWFKPPSGPTQCYNCNQYGHFSKFCQCRPRCFKCAGSHPSKTCLKPVTEPALCCLCGGNHPASSRKCVEYIKAATRQQDKYDRETRKREPRQTGETYWKNAPAPKHPAWQQSKNEQRKQHSQQHTNTSEQDNYFYEEKDYPKMRPVLNRRQTLPESERRQNQRAANSHSDVIAEYQYQREEKYTSHENRLKNGKSNNNPTGSQGVWSMVMGIAKGIMDLETTPIIKAMAALMLELIGNEVNKQNGGEP